MKFLRKFSLLAFCLFACLLPAHLYADQRIENNMAVFSALNKITARIKTIEVPINQTFEFGALSVTPRACYSRPPTEPPKTTAFVEVQERQIDGKLKPIFGGWMFANNPGLHGIEHPVYDVWLTTCKTSSAGKP